MLHFQLQREQNQVLNVQYYRNNVMTSKLTVYIDDSVRQILKDSAGEKSFSELVNDALESYLSASLVGDLSPLGKNGNELPSLSEVARRRPRVTGSSSEIISSQRRDRNARVSR